MPNRIALVVARERLARSLLSSPELLQKYLDRGGLESDLSQIASEGRRAESASVASAHSPEGLASAAEFLDLLGSYVGILAALRAVRFDLLSKEVPAELTAAVDQILTKQARLVPRPQKTAVGRKTNRQKTPEAQRASILDVATTLLELADLQDVFAQRGLSIQRLKRLRQAALKLEGKLTAEPLKKRERKDALKTVRRIADEQAVVWEGCSPVIALLAEDDPRVRILLQTCC